MQKDKKLKGWRVVIGLATGFVFYWLCLYLGIGNVTHVVCLEPG